MFHNINGCIIFLVKPRMLCRICLIVALNYIAADSSNDGEAVVLPTDRTPASTLPSAPRDDLWRNHAKCELEKVLNLTQNFYAIRALAAEPSSRVVYIDITDLTRRLRHCGSPNPAIILNCVKSPPAHRTTFSGTRRSTYAIINWNFDTLKSSIRLSRLSDGVSGSAFSTVSSNYGITTELRLTPLSLTLNYSSVGADCRRYSDCNRRVDPFDGDTLQLFIELYVPSSILDCGGAKLIFPNGFVNQNEIGDGMSATNAIQSLIAAASPIALPDVSRQTNSTTTAAASFFQSNFQISLFTVLLNVFIAVV